MKPGDRVKIMKAGHSARFETGYVMRIDPLDCLDGVRRMVAEVAGLVPRDYLFPLYVVRLEYLEVVESCDPREGRKTIQAIAVQLYERGCVIEFPELITYPNTMAHITG